MFLQQEEEEAAALWAVEDVYLETSRWVDENAGMTASRRVPDSPYLANPCSQELARNPVWGNTARSNSWSRSLSRYALYYRSPLVVRNPERSPTEVSTRRCGISLSSRRCIYDGN